MVRKDGEVPITNEALKKLGVPEDTMRQMEHAVYMYMNYAAGHGKDVIQHGVINGVDASFPRDAWDHLIPQTNTTLNLLRKCTINLAHSAYSCIHGPLTTANFSQSLAPSQAFK